ncbi:peptidoglycan DD-metalloendopeptidase family protein [Chitinophagales bacterium]|nr:peptidoglycan DD-metalloendopeptidase family protein [Chitinophagales bacterium]
MLLTSAVESNSSTEISPVEQEINSFVGPMPMDIDTIFGVAMRGLTVHGDVIKRDQNLSEILTECNVDYPTINSLVEASKGIFDLRNIKFNRPYTVLCANDEDATAEFFIYEHNPVEYLFVDLRDSMKVELRKKKINKVYRKASGIINSSLYETIMQQDLSPALVVELADLYAWTVDFFHIQKGDKFKVIFEEQYAEGEFIGIGQIYASSFVHQGVVYNSYRFDHEELVMPEYYDEDGKSLRKAFLKAPVQYSRISSPYSSRRRHPVHGRVKAHLGTDYAAPRGTPIYATANGTVTKATRNRGNGNYVKIKHNDVYTTQYLHMSKIERGMKPGKRVQQGDVIGYVGSTGLATGPHVCYRFWKNGKQVDARRQKLPEAEALKEHLFPEYEPIRDSLELELQTIEFVEPVEEEEPVAEEEAS